MNLTSLIPIALTTLKSISNLLLPLRIGVLGNMYSYSIFALNRIAEPALDLLQISATLAKTIIKKYTRLLMGPVYANFKMAITHTPQEIQPTIALIVVPTSWQLGSTMEIIQLKHV